MLVTSAAFRQSMLKPGSTGGDVIMVLILGRVTNLAGRPALITRYFSNLTTPVWPPFFFRAYCVRLLLFVAHNKKSSKAGKVGIAGSGPYVGFKFALECFAAALAEETMVRGDLE